MCPALHWIRQHTPPDARFAVNAWLWYGSTYAGSDAGYWIPVLTDRQSILPPVLYSLTLPRPAVEEINARLAAWSADPLLTDPAQLERLRANGVTHIYVGGRSSEAQAGMQAGAQAAALAQLPDLELLYARDSVYIFRIKAADQTALVSSAP